jgi:hypothetical protein
MRRNAASRSGTVADINRARVPRYSVAASTAPSSFRE